LNNLGLFHLRNDNTYFLRSLATNTTKTPTKSSASTTQSQGQTGAQQSTTSASSSGSSSNKTSEFWIYKIDCLKLSSFLESIKGLGRDVVFIDGVRTPFLQSFTAYKDLMGYHLARHALL
jgi:hypothetical protein